MKRFLFIFSILIFIFSGVSAQATFNPPTGAKPDTIVTFIGFPFNGQLVMNYAAIMSKDSLSWVKTSDTTQVQKLHRAKWTLTQIGLPDSTIDAKTKKAKPVLDKKGQPTFRYYTLQVPDSLIYFPKEIDIRKIKKQHNLK